MIKNNTLINLYDVIIRHHKKQNLMCYTSKYKNVDRKIYIRKKSYS